MPPKKRAGSYGTGTQKNVTNYGAPIGDEQYKDQGETSRKDPLRQPAADPDPSPPSTIVIKFHKNAPVDTRGDDIHHTLGPGPTQAAKGSHNHTGGVEGVPLLQGVVITGVKANPVTVMPSIINALVALGATDNTT